MEIKDYRQPFVTSLGVFLGFLLGFLGQWVTEDTFALNSVSDHVVFVGCILGALLLFVALFRMLSAQLPGEATALRAYYQRTLTCYLAGVVLAFFSLLVSAFL